METKEAIFWHNFVFKDNRVISATSRIYQQEGKFLLKVTIEPFLVHGTGLFGLAIKSRKQGGRRKESETRIQPLADAVSVLPPNLKPLYLKLLGGNLTLDEVLIEVQNAGLRSFKVRSI